MDKNTSYNTIIGEYTYLQYTGPETTGILKNDIFKMLDENVFTYTIIDNNNNEVEVCKNMFNIINNL